MAITAVEKWNGRQQTLGDPTTEEVGWIVFGTDDDAQAQLAMLQTAPPDWGGLPIRGSRIVQRLTEESWEGAVTYSSRDADAAKESRETSQPVNPANFEYDFDAGGGTQHVTQSKQTVGNYAASGRTAPNFGGAIGVTEDAVEGVDIVVPQYHWSETHYLKAVSVTDAWIQGCANLVGCTNAGPFKGFATGEVLLIGFAGRRRAQEDWAITFKFARQRNLTGITIGPITGIAKGGWHYLWVRYEKAKDTSASPPRMVLRPASVHVERLYDSGNFAALGIGT